ncbi:hypothetical protein RB195_014660 [Necator americanus]|uniref:Uncharacterized protein n=1 Tax=Necator americanus TaxID=51031 RepID=A0ABR1E124_NECAM
MVIVNLPSCNCFRFLLRSNINTFSFISSVEQEDYEFAEINTFTIMFNFSSSATPNPGANKTEQGDWRSIRLDALVPSTSIRKFGVYERLSDLYNDSAGLADVFILPDESVAYILALKK